MNYKIREMKNTEYGVLNEFLYQAIFIPEGVSAPPREIIDQPELRVYINDFGKKNSDIGLVAEVDHKIVGAAWARIMNDYGHIDDETPSIAISLDRNYRRQELQKLWDRHCLDERNVERAETRRIQANLFGGTKS